MKRISQHTFLIKLYIFAGITFILTIAKHCSANDANNGYFVTMEVLSFIFMLMLLYISDNLYRNSYRKYNNLVNEFSQARTEWENEKQLLQNKLTQYENNDSKKFKSYQDKMINKLFQNNAKELTKHQFLHKLAETFYAGTAIIYKETKPSGRFIVEETYALPENCEPLSFQLGEGMIGQAALDGEAKVIEDIPDDYVPISSGLGGAQGKFLYLLPVLNNGKCQYMIEILSFRNSELEKMWPDISTQLIENEIFF